MPRQITEYRVFIASPGGLQEERQRFRDVLIEYNASDALPRGVVFTPVGWEDTLGGIGRPQSLINEELWECDFFVLVLWDRWGTPPDDDEGRYTSGTEEEFAVAREALSDENAPMRQIVAFFKGVDHKQLADPGPQLSKVLEFRKRLEVSRDLLYQTFDSTDRFAAVLRRHLGLWLLAHEKHAVPTVGLSPESSPSQEFTNRDVELSAEVGSAEVEEAWKLADDGRRTEAETIFSRATVRFNDPNAFIEFGRFLYRDGRLDQAMIMFERAQELAHSSGKHASVATALREIGHIFDTRGDLTRAEECYRKAMQIDEKLGNQEGLANAYTSLGNVLYTRGDLTRAEAMYQKALEIDEAFGKMEGVANLSGNLGILLATRGDLVDAEEMHRKSIKIYEQLGKLDRIGSSYLNLGVVLDRRGDSAGAEGMYQRALTIAEKTGNLEGMANCYGNLGTILLAREDFPGAEAMYRKALEIDEKLGRLGGMAIHYGNLGAVLYTLGDWAGAEAMHRKALEIDIKLGRPEGIAMGSWSLGDVAVRQGNMDTARKLYEEALALFDHIGIPDRAEQVRQLLSGMSETSAGSVE